MNIDGYNTGVGANCMGDLTTGTYNVAVGRLAMGAATTGDWNTAVGYMAVGTGVLTGDHNVCMGYNAGLILTSGYRNTFIGNATGDSVSTGYHNTCVGNIAGETLGTGYNCLILGYNAQSSAADSNNQITLGDANISYFRCNVQTINALSDGRDKTDVVDLPLGVDFINKLRPVKFKWDRRTPDETNGKVRAGFIAQDLQEAQKGSEFMDLVLDENPDKLEAAYANLIPPMVQAIKELSAKVEALESKLNN